MVFEKFERKIIRVLKKIDQRLKNWISHYSVVIRFICDIVITLYKKKYVILSHHFIYIFTLSKIIIFRATFLLIRVIFLSFLVLQPTYKMQ